MPQDEIIQDEIIREVRANREAYAKQFNFDIQAIYSDAKERELKEDRKVVSLAPRRIAASVEKEPR
jgi:tRNA A37 threonylcarbamoyladenosine dehydratase